MAIKVDISSTITVTQPIQQLDYDQQQYFQGVHPMLYV